MFFVREGRVVNDETCEEFSGFLLKFEYQIFYRLSCFLKHCAACNSRFAHATDAFRARYCRVSRMLHVRPFSTVLLNITSRRYTVTLNKYPLTISVIYKCKRKQQNILLVFAVIGCRVYPASVSCCLLLLAQKLFCFIHKIKMC